MTIPSNPLLIHKSHPEVHSSVTQNTHLTTCYPRETLHRDPFSTIEARAQSFQGQVLNGVTLLQLARKGFYYQPNAPFSDMACCFACQAFVRLGSFQRNPLPDRQQLHVNDCVWEVIYDELKQTLESTDILHRSTNVSPPPTQSTPNYHPSSDFEPFKKTTTDASTQTPTRLTRTKPTTVEKSSNTNIDSCA